jgi:hypothetical protein
VAFSDGMGGNEVTRYGGYDTRQRICDIIFLLFILICGDLWTEAS